MRSSSGTRVGFALHKSRSYLKACRALTERDCHLARRAVFSEVPTRPLDVFRGLRTNAILRCSFESEAGVRSARQMPKRGGASRGFRVPLRIESFRARCELRARDRDGRLRDIERRYAAVVPFQFGLG